MSDYNSNIKTTPPSNVKYAWTGVGFIGLILAIGLVVAILYFPNKLSNVTEEVVVQRKATLSEVVSKQKKLLSEYAWLDKKDGIVRIPVGQAMRLVVDDLNKKSSTVK